MINALSKKGAKAPKSVREKFTQKVQTAQEKFEGMTRGRLLVVRDIDKNCSFCDTLLCQLAAKFQECGSLKQKYQVLTVIPGRYNATQISEEVGCSYYIAKKAIEIRNQLGVMEAPGAEQEKNFRNKPFVE
ncbi:hypothetical protein [Staphylococcus aureus]